MKRSFPIKSDLSQLDNISPLLEIVANAKAKHEIVISPVPKDVNAILALLRVMIDGDGEYELTIQPVPKKKRQRTISQNGAVHVYCKLLSHELNDSGFDQKAIIDKFKKGFSLPVTESFIKDIFRECGLVMFKKDSTAKLTTVEIQKVHQAVDMSIAEKTGISVEWPSDSPPIY